MSEMWSELYIYVCDYVHIIFTEFDFATAIYVNGKAVISIRRRLVSVS